MALTNILFFAISLIGLFISSLWLLKSLRIITKFLKLSEFVTGFILLGIGTSLPELFVGITSAIKKTPAISLGNIIGANILDLTLVIGIPILVSRGLKSHNKQITRDSFLMVLMTTLPLILMIIGKEISRIDGIILIIAFSLYIFKLYKQQKDFKRKVKSVLNRKEITLNFIIFFISLLILFKSSDFAIQYAKLLAIDFLLPPIIIGIFLLSFGTTLPELITGTRAALSKDKDLTIGNIIGTVVTNSTLILGIVAVIHPIQAHALYFYSSSIFMIMFAFIFATFISSGKELDWKEGTALILMYILFLFVELNLESFNLVLSQ